MTLILKYTFKNITFEILSCSKHNLKCVNLEQFLFYPCQIVGSIKKKYDIKSAILDLIGSISDNYVEHMILT